MAVPNDQLAVRHHRAQGGIAITASTIPPKECSESYGRTGYFSMRPVRRRLLDIYTGRYAKAGRRDEGLLRESGAIDCIFSRSSMHWDILPEPDGSDGGRTCCDSKWREGPSLLLPVLLLPVLYQAVSARRLRVPSMRATAQLFGWSKLLELCAKFIQLT